MSNLYYVYHIKLSGMGLSDGYIGITNNPRRRWAAHTTKNNTNKLFRNKLLKHGNKIQRVILDVFESREDALWLELTLRPLPNMGWNIQAGGGPSADMSEETKSKISNSLAGRKPPGMTQAGKTRWREKMVGRKASQETRDKLSPQRQGRDNSAAKPVNIFNYEDGSLIAEDVLMSEFCKVNNLHKGHLSQTANGKLKQHKGVYARYI